jgi:hypothetical protein
MHEDRSGGKTVWPRVLLLAGASCDQLTATCSAPGPVSRLSPSGGQSRESADVPSGATCTNGHAGPVETADLPLPRSGQAFPGVAAPPPSI